MSPPSTYRTGVLERLGEDLGCFQKEKYSERGHCREMQRAWKEVS